MKNKTKKKVISFILSPQLHFTKRKHESQHGTFTRSIDLDQGIQISNGTVCVIWEREINHGSCVLVIGVTNVDHVAAPTTLQIQAQVEL